MELCSFVTYYTDRSNNKKLRPCQEMVIYHRGLGGYEVAICKRGHMNAKRRKEDGEKIAL